MINTVHQSPRNPSWQQETIFESGLLRQLACTIALIRHLELYMYIATSCHKYCSTKKGVKLYTVERIAIAPT